ncbi:MAG: histidine kinase [Agriterribacter sp.]
MAESQKARIPFEVIPPPVLDKKVSLQTLLPYILATLSGVALLFWIYTRNNKIKLAKSLRAKENIQFRLKSIRSQLNPHFIFNALGSIQGLINKNDVSAANHYLSKFASLTRKVLEGTEEDSISLSDEIQLLNDYLYMEQLRFGFDYMVKVDETINVTNVEIPVMLLQPLVENAVKHGVAQLQKEGSISIDIFSNNNDLLLAVSDNGKGFKTDDYLAGMGIKLTKERVTLLNTIYKTQSFNMQLDSSAEGTTAIITLHNWL